ncbi:MAG TPA: hypothetical protein PKX48_13850 [Planctomycetota bacterium]|jgi:hypothetical protein|nr:O-antigen ligase family protein [Planctomycetota bacterium]OQC20107.1 MAG: hypothetical protein BWX69_02135 [Planctomycetes bacterium ADurb.Bin069]HNS00549.1 hypothetical protein [Planctomycetota bacterium]HNU26514.1 hypothetical protein [Planctomycetota bacterium]HOE30736.1 hypothetical protein [Planctomycetota bacterium]
MEGYTDLSLDGARRPSPLVVPAMLTGIAALGLLAAQNLYGADFGYLPHGLLAALAAVLTFHDVRVGLGLTIAAIAVSPEFTILEVPNIRMEDFLFPAVLLAWVLRALHRRERPAPTDLAAPLAALVAVTLLATLPNLIYRELPLAQSLWRFGKNIEYYLMFFAALNIARTEREVRVFIHLLWATGLIAALYALCAHILGPAASRLHGIPGETANIAGGYFVFHICIVLGIAAAATGVRRPAYFLIAVAMAVPFVHTMSRASYVALFVGLAVLGALSRDRAIVLFLLVAAALVACTQARDRFETIFGLLTGTPPPAWEARIEGWKGLLPDFFRAPFLGWGVGRASLAIDNEYVRQVYETGLLGLLLFLAVIGRAAGAALRAARTSPAACFRGFALGYLAGTAALLVHSMTAVSFTAIRTAEPFFIATGLVYAILALAPPPEAAGELPSALPRACAASGGKAAAEPSGRS